jgi:tetratricopeptide (TPR) repeat protein
MLFYRWRFALIFLFLGMGVFLHSRMGWQAAWTLYLAAVILLLTHVLFGNVWAAFRLLQHGQLADASRLLDKVFTPKLLLTRNRAYYYFARGILALQQQEMEQGEAHLQRALDLGLFRANDRALARLNLAHVYYVLKQYPAARRALTAAEAEAPTDLLIKENLAKLRRALEQERD